ncbi:MAG TPA: Bd3614 family nucleic acid deaminase, partial [Terracidiphilus sp.]|nr:Bd3614 family nucleic acid deaminase [Terracidiphilus sp.]
NIAAVLVSANNEILGWGLNTNDESTSRHAETNAIQSYQAGQGTALPNGTRIYSTLDPCFMCAALFQHAGGQDCLYEQADTNMTGNTALGDRSVQYHETYMGNVTFSGPTRTPVVAQPISVAQKLDTDRALSNKRAVDFLKTDPALEVYSHAHERLATTGLRAASASDKQLFQHVMQFLRTNGYLGAIGKNDALLPDDDMRPIRPKTAQL